MPLTVQAGRNKFYIGEDETSPQAEITYTFVEEDTIDMTHTFVDPSLRGSGVAKQLFNAVIEKAQNEQLQIIPSCSYVRVQFERDASLQHLLKSSL
ncbi:N-acetyltransferase [Staphylococcus chromogenes]|uniref:GNAT family N-acetyltransferase n=1 Tax=Staphylococcus chromogenes TaxID=46126 RepID=UPI000D024A52|nr:GNAT family N-acetyltransferase [Staphylococcus chromogenes]MCE4971483.1 N-acetyltransferase [Staphylococcus chromogenes]MDT0741203.1 GNAT family N-acetyltransferase [Staphylococcus chromogenes]